MSMAIMRMLLLAGPDRFPLRQSLVNTGLTPLKTQAGWSDFAASFRFYAFLAGRIIGCK